MRNRKPGIVKSKMIAAVSEMPSLDHWPNKTTSDFDIMKSEVCEWLVSQPSVRLWLFEKIKDAGIITYDQPSGKWSGASIRLSHDFNP